MQNIVIFSGAGLSKESGIPTFRDSNDGLWHNHKVEDVATPAGWWKDKELVLNFYRDRWNNIKNCEPNAAHRAIAELEKNYKVYNITQNIDDLLERAGCTDVWHLHGSINRRKCEWHHSIFHKRKYRFTCDYEANHDKPVELGEMCKCGGQLRPNVVWFDEAVDMKEEYLKDLINLTDIFICIGTSAQVYPAASLLFEFRACPKKYFIDPTPALRLHSYTKLQGTACEHMPKLTEELISYVY